MPDLKMSEEDVRILLQIIERTNFSGRDIEKVTKIKLDLKEVLPKTAEIKERENAT